jgi:hypothetical protein
MQGGRYLGPIPGFRWCGETDRYFAIVSHGSESIDAVSASNQSPVHSTGSSNCELEKVQRSPVDENLLRSFPSFYRRKRERAQSEDCPICLRSGLDGKVDRRLRFITLPCKHTFHFYCAAEWLNNRSGCCPICRTPVDTSLAIAASSVR